MNGDGWIERRAALGGDSVGGSDCTETSAETATHRLHGVKVLKPSHSRFLCLLVCLSVCFCLFVCLLVFVCLFVCLRVCVCMHVYVYVYVCVCVRARAPVPVSFSL